MQVRAVGRASRRAGGIGVPQTSQTPYVASSTRTSAASTSADLVAGVLGERAHLGALEGDGRALRVVLVVGVGVPRRLDHAGVVAGQVREPGAGPAQRGLEDRARVGVAHRSRGVPSSGAPASRLSAMILRWISEVPSKILVSRASRQ